VFRNYLHVAVEASRWSEQPRVKPTAEQDYTSCSIRIVMELIGETELE